MSNLKSNNNLVDKGWALMEEQLNVALPVKKPKRRYLFFLLPFICILAIASYWLIPGMTSNTKDGIEIDSKNIDMSKEFAENLKEENELFGTNSLTSEINENKSFESQNIIKSNRIRKLSNKNLSSTKSTPKIDDLDARKINKSNIETASIEIKQDESILNAEVSPSLKQENELREMRHDILSEVSPLLSLEFSEIAFYKQKALNKIVHISPYKPNRNTIGIKSGVQMGSEIPVSGAELGITYAYQIGRRWSINTGASFDYINHKNETARAVQFGSGNVREYEVNGGWLSTGNDEAFELPDQFFNIPLTVSYRMIDRVSIYAGPSLSFGIPTSFREKIGLKGSSDVADYENVGLPIEVLFEEKNSQTQDFGDFTFKKNLLFLNAGIQYHLNQNWSIDLGFTTTLEKGRSYYGLKLSDPDFSADLVTQAEVSPYLEKLLPKWYGSISISRRVISF